MSAYQKLETVFTTLFHLQHLQAISRWDEAVMMPSGGGQARANALATLSRITHETLTQPELRDLIEQAKFEKLNDPWQQANLKWIEKKYRLATCLPSDLVQQLTEATIRCEQAWRIFRPTNNWNEFAPLLAKNLQLIKESAQIQAEVFHKSPYDQLIDSFSPDIDQSMIDPIFNKLKNVLPNLIQQAMEKQKKESILTPKGHFPAEQQRQLGLKLMQAIGFDFNQGRLDVSHHPFCGGVPQDVRITTRYDENEFITSAMAICHETGHACYEQGLPRQWIHQPVGESLGMAVHESQSLLIEMQACRTFEFMHFLSPLVKNQFGGHSYASPENLYRLYTRVKPGFIRVDADEMTYPLHIVLRYELEKQLIQGDLAVNDLPQAWDERMTHYLGLSTKDNYQQGVMQDVHWPSGAFGYFPAYTLGGIIAAQLFHAAVKQYPEIHEELTLGKFTHLMRWLRQKIHCQASSLPFTQLIEKATGEALSPDYFIRHLEDRYLNTGYTRKE